MTTADPKKLLKLISTLMASLSDYEDALYNAFMTSATGALSKDEEDSLNEETQITETAYRADLDVGAQVVELLYEVLGLHLGRTDFSTEYKEAKRKDGGEFKIDFIPQNDTFVCSGHEIVKRSYDILSAALGVSDTKREVEQEIVSRKIVYNDLLNHLRNTGFYVRNLSRENVSLEGDIQRIMHVVLEARFKNDYVKRPQVSNAITNFHPDGGLKSIGTAIEYKFIDSREELSKALRGIYEDMVGYSSSKDWRRFITVFYMTDHFTPVETVQRDTLEKGVGKWEAVVIFASGARRKKSKKKTTRKKVRKAKKKK